MFIKRVTAVALAAFLLFSSVILQQVAAADTASLTAASAADSTLQPDVAEASNSTALPAEGAAKPDRATAGLTPLEKKLEPATVKEAANKPEVASNEEKKNDHYLPRPLPEKALQQQRSAQINLNTPQALTGDALPPWRDKLEEADVMKMQGCEAIADDAAKLVIIRPKNGAKEGFITCLDPGKEVKDDDIAHGNATKADKDYYEFFSARNAEAEAIEKFIAEHPGYTLHFEGRIYFYKELTRGKVPRDIQAHSFLKNNKLASLGNIGDVNVRFMTSAYALLKNDTEIKDIKELSKWKFQTNHNADFGSYFEGMESLTGYTDFSKWQSDFNIVYMESMFQNAGTDDFVLNFSNLNLYYKGGSLYSITNLQNTFNGFRGVLVANNWKVDFEYTKRNTTRHVNALIASKNTKTEKGRTKLINKLSLKDPNLFGQTEEQTKNDYILKNLVVTDNPDLLELGAKAKYYKEITIK